MTLRPLIILLPIFALQGTTCARAEDASHIKYLETFLTECVENNLGAIHLSSEDASSILARNTSILEWIALTSSRANELGKKEKCEDGANKPKLSALIGLLVNELNRAVNVGSRGLQFDRYQRRADLVLQEIEANMQLDLQSYGPIAAARQLTEYRDLRAALGAKKLLVSQMKEAAKLPKARGGAKGLSDTFPDRLKSRCDLLSDPNEKNKCHEVVGFLKRGRT